jgi:DNA adenine methylase
MAKNPLVKPFLKWAGGKRQLIPALTGYFPKKTPKIYYEPFIGGGALLLHLQYKNVVFNDSNSELINCYEVVRDSVDELIEALRTHVELTDEDYYYKIRSLDRECRFKEISKIDRAARIIFLNKTCYNGLFRVNSHGQFNVPFGRYKNPNILDEGVLRAVSGYLSGNKIKIENLDFGDIIRRAKKGDFVYLDPPYDPVSETASFTGYDVNGFNKEEQERLKKEIDNATDRECKIMQSNASTPFIHDLYDDPRYKIFVVPVNRAINSNALARGKVDEVIILNYDPEKE